jgi:hypothetical protein
MKKLMRGNLQEGSDLRNEILEEDKTQEGCGSGTGLNNQSASTNIYRE